MVGTTLLLLATLVPYATSYLAPLPLLTDRTANSIRIQFAEYVSRNGGVNLAYEVSSKSLTNTDWVVFDRPDVSSTPRNAAYLLSVKVDADKSISSGFYQLGYGHSSTTPYDSEKRTYSAPIPWDASPAQVQTALGFIQGIKVNQVTRCQEGFDGPLFSCPFASQGAFQWLIILDIPVNELPIDLYVHRSEFGNTWSDVKTQQVTVDKFQPAMTSPNMCYQGICVVTVTGLASSMGYSFRIRVLSTLGWSEYSTSSSYVSTLDARPPTRPSAPQLLATSSGFVSMQIIPASRLEGVTLVESQYRRIKASSWSIGPFIDPRIDHTLTLTAITNSVLYEMRVRYGNHFGLGPYSSPSEPFSLQRVVSSANLSIDTLFNIADVTSTSVTLHLHSDSNVVLGSSTYEIQYKQIYSNSWRAVVKTPVLISSLQGVAVQEISTRSDYQGTCFGTFRLSVGTVDPSRTQDSTTSDLSYDSSAVDVLDALTNIPVIRTNKIIPRIVVKRRNNLFNGYIWNVEIQGYEHLLNIHVFNIDLSTNNGTSCFMYGDPVVVEVLEDGAATLQTQSTTLIVTDLIPQTNYTFRLHLITSGGLDLISIGKNATTLVDLTIEVPMSTLGNSKQAYSELMNRPVGGSIIAYGNGKQAARTSDFYYMDSIGEGGGPNFDGKNGYCVGITHDLYKVSMQKVKYFLYKPSTYKYSVPSNSDTTQFVTFKCWGGGGAGSKLSSGGGAGFAQITIRVNRGDVFTVDIGGAGRAPSGELGGKGGYSGGGDGGESYGGGGGGGGGGVSVVYRNGKLVLAAAGGGGAGSTDYCCSDGGFAGGATGGSGLAPTSNTPFPINSSTAASPVTRRYEYTSFLCPNTSGAFCISEWDILPKSLPALHEHLEYGFAPEADYSVWAVGGVGGGKSSGGIPGSSGSYKLSASTNQLVPYGDGLAAVYTLIDGLSLQAMPGRRLKGGSGADGHDGGGGGGGGYYGGGGGGSGIDGAGGGGGSSYFDSELVALSDAIFDSASVLHASDDECALLAFSATNIESLQLNSDESSSKLVSASTRCKGTVIMGTPIVEYVDDTSVKFSFRFDVNKAFPWGVIRKYDIEIAIGEYSEDFKYLTSIESSQPSVSSTNIITTEYFATQLMPSTYYRFRAIPVFSKGVPRVSKSVTVKTLMPATNYWEPVFVRRNSRAVIGRGYSDPVVLRPHIDYPNNANTSTQTGTSPYVSDAPFMHTPSVPSARRGHTCTRINDIVYMFGGYTSGYCEENFTNNTTDSTLNNANYISACMGNVSEVSELWTLDIHSYEWQLVHTHANSTPSAREQHSSFELNGNLYIYGGKSFNGSSNGPVIYGDLWKLNVPQNSSITYSQILRQVIPDDERLISSITATTVRNDTTNSTSAREGQCVVDMSVNVVLSHSCANQLRISLIGPGPSSSSPNYHSPQSSVEAILFSQGSTNGSGCVAGLHNFTFRDDAMKNTFDCCPQSYTGEFRPETHLSSFMRSSPYADWKLIVQDMVRDKQSGSLVSWSLQLVTFPCSTEYTWNEVKVRGSIPPERHQAKVIVANASVFVYGGIGITGAMLNDLWRFDSTSLGWTQLTLSNGSSSINTAAYGQSMVIVPNGVLLYGGYSSGLLQWNEEGSEQDKYGSKVVLVNILSRFRSVLNTSAISPAMRYLTSTVYIPSSAIRWKNPFSHSHIYDGQLDSSHTNYAGSIIDSLLVFGGDNGMSGGSRINESTGGLLNDMWMVRLSELSTLKSKEEQHQLHIRLCSWRRSVSASAFGSTSCFGQTFSNCEFTTLLKLAWCNGEYQTIA